MNQKRSKKTLFQNRDKFLIVIIIIVLGIILISYLNIPEVFVMTGKTVALYENDSDFSTGTFTNTTFSYDSVTLNKPVPVGDYNNSVLPYSIDGADSVYVSGDYAYVTSYQDDSLTILNISNKSNPTPVGDYNDSVPPYSLDYPYSVFISGDYAYVTSYLDASLTILNISNKSNPTPVGDYNDSVPPYSIDSASSVFVSGDYAYVTSRNDDSLTILNISNKSNPEPVGDYNDDVPPYSIDGATFVYVSEDYAYVTSDFDDSLTILNISNKSNPTPVGDYNNSALPYSIDGANSVYVVGDYAYVPSFYDYALTILNISNKSNPTPVGDYNDSESPYFLNGASGVFISGDYAYVTSLNVASLTILNISNKSNPTPIGDYIDSDPPYSIDWPRSVYVSGNYIYVTSESDDSLTILKDEFFQLGTYESEIINATYTINWINVSWDETEPSQTNLSLAFRSCDDSACSGETWSSWYNDSPNLLDGISNNQYFQFKAKLETTNSSITPELNSVNIFYSCIESWTCTDWSICSGGTQTRTCTDANNCETTVNRPIESQSCTSNGGGSAGITEQPTETHTWINVNESLEMEIDNTEIDLTKITIKITEIVQSASLTVTKIAVLPQTDIEMGLPSGSSYQTFKIDTTGMNDTNIENVTVEFKVNKSWLEEQNGTINNVTLYRKQDEAGQWNALETTFVSEDSQYYYFSAISPEFSSFVIFIGTRACNPGEIRCFNNELQLCVGDYTWVITEKCKGSCENNKCVEGSKIININTGSLLVYIVIVVLSAGILVVLYLVFRYFSKKHVQEAWEKSQMMKK